MDRGTPSLVVSVVPDSGTDGVSAASTRGWLALRPRDQRREESFLHQMYTPVPDSIVMANPTRHTTTLYGVPPNAAMCNAESQLISVVPAN